jgi:hypothetical protein
MKSDASRAELCVDFHILSTSVVASITSPAQVSSLASTQLPHYSFLFHRNQANKKIIIIDSNKKVLTVPDTSITNNVDGHTS